MVNVAVLGAGFMGATHAGALARLADVRVVGVSSRSEARAAELAAAVGALPFTDALRLATHEQVDAVCVTLPTPLHERFAVAALEAGKHVLVEKPMALTVAGCDAMIDAARRNGRLLMVAHVLRFWPEYTALVALVRSGRLGDPISAGARRLSTRPTWGDWFADPEASGGAVHDLHIHDLDALNWLFGRPRSVYARGRRGPGGGWDHVLTLAEYGPATAPVSGFAEGSFLMPEGHPFTMGLVVHCRRGVVEFGFRAGGSGVASGAAGGSGLVVREAGGPPRRLEHPAGDAYELQLAHFVRCVREGVAPEQGTAAQGRLAVEVALAARRSLDGNGVVAL